MNDEELQALIKERMNKLPELVQGAVNSLEWQEVVRKIVERNNLRIDQGEVIETEVFLAMLGITNPKDFTKHLVENGRIEQEMAEKITLEIEENIFRAIRSIIELEAEKRNNPEAFSEEEEESNTPKQSEEKKLPTVEEMLQEIEDNPSQQESKTREVPDFIIGNIAEVKKETLQDKPSEKNVTHKQSSPPNNLPVGDISDVPKHGHGHQKEVSNSNTSEPEAKVIPKPQEHTPTKEDESDLITKNLTGVSSLPKEDVDFSVRNIDKAMESSDNKPSVDPYRESV